MYIPLKYTAIAKYTPTFMIDQIVLVDMLLAVVASSSGPESLFVHLICIPFFVLSLMCVYEIGYFENDTIGVQREARPVITDKVNHFVGDWMELKGWASAIFFAGTGFLLTNEYAGWRSEEWKWRSVEWTIALSAIRVTFFAYNRRPVEARMPLYFLLQILKYGSNLLIFPPTFCGAVLVSSQILTMSVVYLTYRLGGRQKTINREVLRLMVVAGIAAPMLLSVTQNPVDGWWTATLTGGWLMFRIVKQAILTASKARRSNNGD